MSLEKNVADAKYARELLRMSEINTPAFWDAVLREAKAHLPDDETKSTQADVMDDREARKFENVTFPFGKYQGSTVGEVPVDYLLFITENDFGTKLKRYLKSKVFQERQV